MRGRLVRPGDKVGEVLTAQAWNEIMGATDRINGISVPPRQPLGTISADLPSLTVAADNQTGGVVAKQEVVGFDTPAILPTEAAGDFHNRVILKGESPVAHCFGIATNSIGAGDVGALAIAGIVSCRLMVPSNGAWITRADIDPTSDERLLATPSGSAQILWKDTGTNTVVDAIVRLGCPENVQLVGKTVSAVAPNSSGPVTVWLNGVTTNYQITVHLDWMHNGEQISAGRQVLISYFPVEQRWRFVGAECES